MTKSLINKDRTWKVVVCRNPEHELVKFKTNSVGDIHCPTCKGLMVVEINPRWELYGKRDTE